MKISLGKQKWEDSRILSENKHHRISLYRDNKGQQYIAKQYHTRDISEARREFLYMQTIKGDSIAKALELEDGESPTLWMEYVEGKTFTKACFVDDRDFEIQMTHLFATLAGIHGYGICLNDIMPSNIIANGRNLTFIDFGLATVNLFNDGFFRGAPAFSAPEKILRQTNHFASDLFSMGMLWFYYKNNQTVYEIIGEQEYQKAVRDKETWDHRISLLETDEFVRTLLAYTPKDRPDACDATRYLAQKYLIKLDSLTRLRMENYLFKCQLQAVERLWKKKTIQCTYADEPMKIENILSLWIESDNQKMVILDESIFLLQPDEFFKPFPIGYRQNNTYQDKLVEWLNEQDIQVVLRRYQHMKTSAFFNILMEKTNALQIWISNESELKNITIQEMQEVIHDLPMKEPTKQKLKQGMQINKPFYARLALLSLLSDKPVSNKENPLVDFIDWIQLSIPISFAEHVWQDWCHLVRDGLLQNRLILDGNMIKPEFKSIKPKTIHPELIKQIIDKAKQGKYYNISGAANYLIGEMTIALESWTQYVEVLVTNQYFSSAYEFIQSLRGRFKKDKFSFELLKKEAFLARICGNFEESLRLYQTLLNQVDGLVKAVLSVDQAIVLQALNRNDEAIASYRSAIELFRLHQDWKSLFRAMNNLGVVYFGLHRYADAELLFNEVLTEARSLNNIQFETISYLNLADIQLKRGEWNRSIYFAEKAVLIASNNTKWNLYTNGSIILARAQFSRGEYEKAIDILNELRQDQKTKENLLQYQEVISWLISFIQVVEPKNTTEIIQALEIPTSSYHEILLRELFFVYFHQRKYLTAMHYLEQLPDIKIMRAFFDSDINTIIEYLKEYKAHSEIDTYLYYVSHIVNIWGSNINNTIEDFMKEAIELYNYQPIQYLLAKREQNIAGSVYWEKISVSYQQCKEINQTIQLTLNYVRALVSFQHYIYFDYRNTVFTPIVAQDMKGNNIPHEEMLVSQHLLEQLQGVQGLQYRSIIEESKTIDMYSSTLGLGVSTVISYDFTINEQKFGLFYCDSQQELSIEEDIIHTLRVVFSLAQSTLERLYVEEKAQESSEITVLREVTASSNQMIGNSKVMQDVYNRINMVAAYDVNVLIIGPTGSGKELVARAIHNQFIEKNHSLQKQPFIPVNCAAIPEQLLESELFGYRKGAFTGAVADKRGKILAADNGTIFLDEIGELPLLLQAKLLRVIQEKVVTPLGSEQDYPVNVRIIAATNQNLEEMIETSTFRADLYYRLKVVTIQIPGLSERREDIPLLVMFFLQRFNNKFKKAIQGIHPKAISYLQQKEWKGNVRELENEMERAVLLCLRDYLSIEDFTSEPEANVNSIFRNLPVSWQEFKDYKQRVEDELEKRYIRQLLEQADENITQASKLGNLERMQIYRLLRKLETQ